MRKQYPDDLRKAVQETIRICRAQDVLASYLAEEEAATVMFTFADQEREYNRVLRKEREDSVLYTLVSLVKKHLLSVKDAAEQANMSEEEFVKKTGLKI